MQCLEYLFQILFELFALNYSTSFIYLKSNKYINLIKINRNVNKNPCKNHNNCSRETENIIFY